MGLLGDDQLLDQAPDGGLKDVNTRDQVNKVTDAYGPSLFEPDRGNLLFWVIIMSFQFWARRIGALSGLPLLRHPQNAQTLLLPALEAIDKTAPLLWAEAPAALLGIDLDGVRKRSQRLSWLRGLIARAEDFVLSLRALETHLEQDLDGTARLVYERTESLIQTHRSLGQELQPLVKLVTQSAEEAAETRKVVKKAKQEGRDEALKEVAARDKEGDPSRKST
jgi:hypothetical protein